MNINRTKIYILGLFSVVLFLGIFIRLWHIDFGLPHVTYADEDKLGNFGIELSYKLKGIILSKDFSKLAPLDFVYGTFSLYLNAKIILIWKIFLSIFNKEIDFYNSYVVLRVVNAFFSLLIPVSFSLLYFKIFQKKFGAFFLFFLLLFNWKLIVHAHYLNTDSNLTILLALTFLFFYKYLENSNIKNLFLTALVFGFAVGTKITALISLPTIIVFLLTKKLYKQTFLFLTFTLLFYLLSNPFSLIQGNRFINRLKEMGVKENGVVFDSVDFSPIKYINSIDDVIGTAYFILSFISIIFTLANYRKNKFLVFLIANLVTYLLFFTFSLRRVDRWILPTIPIVLFFSVLSIEKIYIFIRSRKSKYLYVLFFFSLISVTFFYLYKPYTLLSSFKRYTPQVESFLWAKRNINNLNPKILITDTSLDPNRSLRGIKLFKSKIYSSQMAEIQKPPLLETYEFIIVSSRPLYRYKNPTLKQLFPNYYAYWKTFDTDLFTNPQFELVNYFKAKEPNLVPFSNMYIFKNKNFIPIIQVQLNPETSNED